MEHADAEITESTLCNKLFCLEMNDCETHKHLESSSKRRLNYYRLTRWCDISFYFVNLKKSQDISDILFVYF